MGSDKRGNETEGIDALQAVKNGIDYVRGKGDNPICIVSHPQWTSRGFVFVTKNENRYYILANTHDVEIAMAKMYMAGTNDLCDYAMGVPFSNHDIDRELALGGQYIWTFMLQ